MPRPESMVQSALCRLASGQDMLSLLQGMAIADSSLSAKAWHPWVG